MLDTGKFSFSLSNYKSLFDDDWFWKGAKNTTIYMIYAVPITVCISIILALEIKAVNCMRRLVIISFFFPMITSGSAIGYVWRYMFHERVGLLNYCFSSIGITPVRWLSDIRFTMVSMLVFGVWKAVPLATLLLYSGLSQIDDSLSEAASIDGANRGQVIFYIILPLWLNTVFAVTLINAINFIKVFDELFFLFQGKPGPFYIFIRSFIIFIRKCASPKP